jgi:hypothetical protein
MVFDLLPEISGSKEESAQQVVDELLKVPIACIAQVLYSNISLDSFRAEDAKETGLLILFFLTFLDSHLLAKLLRDKNSQIVWLTHCLLSTKTSLQQGAVTFIVQNAFPFGCEVTIDELHRAFRSWMEIKSDQVVYCLMYKSIIHFHKGLKILLPTIVPDDVNCGRAFVLDWYQMEAAIIKNNLGLNPLDADTLENSPFRRVS